MSDSNFDWKRAPKEAGQQKSLEKAETCVLSMEEEETSTIKNRTGRNDNRTGRIENRKEQKQGKH